ncbi:hypothetical protein [Paraburkholderia sp.]|uniref:hypothetical protein n=1 Tax=Paraburkholderia sp. TaxID=1926495 RepID=UPI0039E58278
MLTQTIFSETNPAPRDGHHFTASAVPDLWTAYANAQAQACADYVALCQETWARCALTRSPLECLSIAGLMLPACVSSAMRYCKNVSEITGAWRDLAGHTEAAPSPPAAAPR